MSKSLTILLKSITIFLIIVSISALFLKTVVLNDFVTTFEEEV